MSLLKTVLDKRKQMKSEDLQSVEEASLHHAEMITINSPGHHLHNKPARVSHRHGDGRVTVQVTHSAKKGHVSNLSLSPSQFVKGVVNLDKKESGMKEETLPAQTKMKHRFLVTYSDSKHTMVSKRKEKMQKHVLAPTTDKEGRSVFKGDAEPLVRKHMTNQGYKVHDIEHVGMVSKTVKEEVSGTDMNIEEAKATMCGRCGTKHVPPSKGGTCPALKENQNVQEIRMSSDDEAKYNVDYGKRATKLLKHSWNKSDEASDKRKAGDTAGAETSAKTSSRAHKLFLKAKERHLKDPERAEKYRSKLMSGASDYYKSKKPGQYTGDSFDPTLTNSAPTLDEVSKKMLSKYIERATGEHGHYNMARRNTTGDQQKEFARKETRCQAGISKAIEKLDAKQKVTEATSAAVRMQRALQKAKEERERRERLAKPFVDKVFGKKEDNMKKLSQIVEEANEKIHPNALHVKPVKANGQTKYHVHAVGKNFAHGIKVGEHLSDSELDDFSEMGGKIKHVK